jgi:hypothetical protein
MFVYVAHGSQIIMVQYRTDLLRQMDREVSCTLLEQ